MQSIRKMQEFEYENKFVDSNLTLSLQSLYKKVNTPWLKVVEWLRSWREWITEQNIRRGIKT